MSNQSAVPISRGSVRPMSRKSQHGRRAGGGAHPAHVGCNKCRKPLTTNAYMTACSCLFCEPCAYAHFEQSETCPLCKTHLAENDIYELVVADPPAGPDETRKRNLQSLFTKDSTQNRELYFSGMCRKLLSHVDNLKFETTFMLMQLMKESRRQASRNAGAGQQIGALKHQMESLKQKTSSEKLEYENVLKGHLDRLSAQDQQIMSLKQELQEKESIIGKFRSHHEARTVSSRGTRGGSAEHGSAGSGHRRQQLYPSISQDGRRLENTKFPPPMQALQQQPPPQTPSGRGLIRRGQQEVGLLQSALQSARSQEMQRHPYRKRAGPDDGSYEESQYSGDQSIAIGGLGAGAPYYPSNSPLGRHDASYLPTIPGTSRSQQQHTNKRRRSAPLPMSSQGYGTYQNHPQRF